MLRLMQLGGLPEMGVGVTLLAEPLCTEGRGCNEKGGDFSSVDPLRAGFIQQQGCPSPLLQGGDPEATVRGRLVSQVPYLPLMPM